jgi:hypothetical protein
MSSQEIRHAFFSKKQKEHLSDRNIRGPNGQLRRDNTNIYLTTDGREVEVTEVCKEADSYNKKGFPDFIYLGQVTKWVRVVKDD